MARTRTLPSPSEMTFAPLGAESGRGPVEVTSAEQVADVVAWIRSPYRQLPVVLVTGTAEGSAPPVDASAVSKAHPLIAVYSLGTGHLTRTLAALMPDRWEVYGGGARVYPAGVDVGGDPRKAPLFLVAGPADAARATGAVLEALRDLACPASTTPFDAKRGGRSSSATPKTSGVTTVDEAAGAVALARMLESSDRRHPVVVVTNATGQKPFLDADKITSELDDLASVFVVRDGSASWAFTGALQPRLGVFGGAARVYPIGLDWIDDETRAPLFFCWDGRDASAITHRVIDAGFNAAAAAGLLQVPAGAVARKTATATVVGVLGSHHVLMKLRGGGQAVALADAIRTGVSADRLVAKGQRLTGSLLPGAASIPRFAADPVPSAPLPGSYVDGAVVLAKVLTVARDEAQIGLQPDVEVPLLADPEAPDLRDLIEADAVVAVQLVGSAPAFTARLADCDDLLVQCAPVIPGGPPWLLPSDLSEQEQEPATEVAVEPKPAETAPAPSPLDVGRAAAMQRERDLITSQLAALEDHVQRLKREASHLRREVREATKNAKRAKAAAEGLQARAHGRGVFADPAEQLRHEVWIEYLHRLPEGQRAGLAEYTLGPRYLDSLDNLQGISRDKVVEVMVEVLTGLAKELNGRELHPWRTAITGQQEVRDDGAGAWRVSLQVKTASARRMKYWQLPGGAIEFDFVGVHDDGL